MPRTGFRNFVRYRSRNSRASSGRSSMAVAQRRHADRDDVDPVVQVFAEAALLHRFLEVHVGRDDQAEIGPDAASTPPTRSISPSWIARSSLACRSNRRSPISSRNSVPPVGQLELSELLSVRAGKGAALVSEERALDQFVRDR